MLLQDNRPTGTIPLAGNKVIRHPDDPKQQQGFKFEIQCKLEIKCQKKCQPLEECGPVIVYVPKKSIVL